MPEFRQASEIEPGERGDGWTLSVLADHTHVPGMAMVARRWVFEPGAHGPEEQWTGDAERFLYVIAGSGRLKAGNRHSDLGPESVVWLEPGDRFRLQAGDDGLEVLDATSGAADPMR